MPTPRSRLRLTRHPHGERPNRVHRRCRATHAADSLSKGDRALVLGRLKTRSWETPEGERRSVVEVEAEEVGPSLKWATAKLERANGKAKADAATGTGSRKGGRR